MAAMRHTLTVFGAEVRGALSMAKTPLERATAIIRTSFSAMNFRSEVVAAWLNFYVQALKSEEAARLLNIYQRRLRSNLHHAIRQVAEEPDARMITRGLAAMIDGLYLRQALRNDPIEANTAIDVMLHYLDSALARKKHE